MKNLKRFKNFLFESSDYIESNFDEETRDSYIYLLDDLASLPILYKKYGIPAWVSVIDDLPYSDFVKRHPQGVTITKRIYDLSRSKYKEHIKKNPQQEKIDEFLVAISGEYDYELFQTYSKKPIEWWIKEFEAFPPHIPYIAKSVWDGANLMQLKLKKIK